MKDEHYIGAYGYEIRSSIDRRFWHTGGVQAAIHFGIVDDYGDIVPSWMRP